ncbi:hypothetical protein [Corallococcus terminator]|uniref:Uncharacterized protein n=1 Tax=Corallococcus terminator TaxID=2316733 RepID=A0A3A8ISI7_9BACT|nr:hypothetical protein [Corallococcus terminator]RKG85648.1 hypothetical protein D7V88_19530 [Corallococcus terminator]
MLPSAEALKDIARDYWPSRNDDTQEPGPEAHRLHSLWARKLQERASWDALIEQMKQEFSEDTVADITATSDACFRCAVYPSEASVTPGLRWVLVGCASILAPVFTVYRVQFEYGVQRTLRQLELEASSTEVAIRLARILESTLGTSLIPLALAKLPVPLFVHWKAPPDTTLFHALFTSTPERIP